MIASTFTVETSVPSVIITMQAIPSSDCERNRSIRVPAKSTNSSIANAPNAMKYDITGLAMTFTPSASSAGIRIAARPARRSAL